MNPWKIATIVLAALLFFAVAAIVQGPTVLATTSNQTNVDEMATLREAVGDTKAFLNWYRMNVVDDEISAESYESNIRILRNRYIHHFPELSLIHISEPTRPY